VITITNLTEIATVNSEIGHPSYRKFRSPI